jgi:uncharacterized membrane protein HdeD (DUF308 family)
MDMLVAANAELIKDEMRRLRQHWGWYLALGIFLAAIGTFAIMWACLAKVTVAITWLFGFVLLAGGISAIVSSFWAGRWSGMLVHLLLGILYTLAGLLIIDQPVESALGITLIIAVLLIFAGIFRIVFALMERFSGWNWVLLNGIVTLFLGLMIYKQWPASGLWVIGLFVGIDLIFDGWAWIMFALGLRQIPVSE